MQICGGGNPKALLGLRKFTVLGGSEHMWMLSTRGTTWPSFSAARWPTRCRKRRIHGLLCKELRRSRSRGYTLRLSRCRGRWLRRLCRQLSSHHPGPQRKRREAGTFQASLAIVCGTHDTEAGSQALQTFVKTVWVTLR